MTQAPLTPASTLEVPKVTFSVSQQEVFDREIKRAQGRVNPHLQNELRLGQAKLLALQAMIDKSATLQLEQKLVQAHTQIAAHDAKLAAAREAVMSVLALLS